MRIFHIVGYDGQISAAGSTAVGNRLYSPPEVDALLGSVETLHIGGYTAMAGGTSPTLTIEILGSMNGVNWFVLPLSPAISGLALSLSAETLFQASEPDPDSNVRFPLRRLGIYLGGTNPFCELRVWITGRDSSRRLLGLAGGVPKGLDSPQRAIAGIATARPPEQG